MKFIFLIFGVLFIQSQCWSFPEFVRRGYINCTACHVSLSGGEMLTPYGRSLSKELLSQPTLFGYEASENEEQLLYGKTKTPEWLQLGGDIRLLQTFIESPKASQGKFIIMQVDLNAWAEVSEKIKAFFSLGRIDTHDSSATWSDFIYSPRYGLDFLISNPEAERTDRIRIGRFMPAFGINFSEHTFVTRQWLDFGPGQERLALEYSQATDQKSLIVTAITSQYSGHNVQSEVGGIIQYNMALREHSKIGINYYQTERKDPQTHQLWTRKIWGAYGIFGINKSWYALMDLNRPQNSLGQWGFITTAKVGHEYQQGLHFFGVYEFANTNIESANPKYESYGLGSQWFPAPHWDLYGLYKKERNTATTESFQDTVWLIGHYYF